MIVQTECGYRHEPATREELKVLMANRSCRGSQAPLEISLRRLQRVSLAGLELRWMNIYGLADGDGGDEYSEIDFGDANFVDCTFHDCKLASCSFARATFERTSFRGSAFCSCDFRYCTFRDSTLAEARLIQCDFYRTEFAGIVVFERTSIENCSFHRALLDGADMEWASVKRHGIVQASPKAYAAFLQKQQRLHAVFVRAGGVGHELSDRDIERYVAVSHLEAAAIYRKFSALFAASGRFTDSSKAYVQARRFERHGMRPYVLLQTMRAEAELRQGSPPRNSIMIWTALRKFPEFVALLIADGVCRFGSSVTRVIASLILLTVIAAVLYRVCGMVRFEDHAASFADCLSYSLGNVLARGPDRVVVSAGGRLLGDLQSFLSIGLIGLLGFVLGNYLRQS